MQSSAARSSVSSNGLPPSYSLCPDNPARYRDYLIREFGLPRFNGTASDFTAIINLGECVSSSTLGQVYKGRYQPSVKDPHMPLVSVKVIQLLNNKERDIWRNYMRSRVDLWACLDHDNILPLIGVANTTKDQDIPAVISPWIENGTVTEFLKSHPAHSSLGFLKGIMEGLYYLHSCGPDVVHGNLRAENVLVNHRKEVYLCNFLVHPLEPSLRRIPASSAAGEMRWLAPEVVRDGRKTKASDMFAYGMTCWEILAGQVPFESIQSEDEIRAKIAKDERPERIPARQPDAIWNVITRCWKRDPGSRPESDEILQLVRDAVAREEIASCPPTTNNYFKEKASGCAEDGIISACDGLNRRIETLTINIMDKWDEIKSKPSREWEGHIQELVKKSSVHHFSSDAGINDTLQAWISFCVHLALKPLFFGFALRTTGDLDDIYRLIDADKDNANIWSKLKTFYQSEPNNVDSPEDAIIRNIASLNKFDIDDPSISQNIALERIYRNILLNHNEEPQTTALHWRELLYKADERRRSFQGAKTQTEKVLARGIYEVFVLEERNPPQSFLDSVEMFIRQNKVIDEAAQLSHMIKTGYFLGCLEVFLPDEGSLYNNEEMVTVDGNSEVPPNFKVKYRLGLGLRVATSAGSGSHMLEGSETQTKKVLLKAVVIVAQESSEHKQGQRASVSDAGGLHNDNNVATSNKNLGVTPSAKDKSGPDMRLRHTTSAGSGSGGSPFSPDQPGKIDGHILP